MKTILAIALVASLIGNAFLAARLGRVRTSERTVRTGATAPAVPASLRSESRTEPPSTPTPTSTQIEDVLLTEVVRLQDQVAVLRSFKEMGRQMTGPSLAWEELYADLWNEAGVGPAFIADCVHARSAANRGLASELLEKIAQGLDVPPADRTSFVDRTLAAVDSLRKANRAAEEAFEQKRAMIERGSRNRPAVSPDEWIAIDTLEKEKGSARKQNLLSAMNPVLQGLRQNGTRFAFFREVLPDLLQGLSVDLKN